MNIYTCKDAADKLDLSFNSIRVYCRRYNIGKKIGTMWILEDGDIEEIKKRMGQVGRPSSAREN